MTEPSDEPDASIIPIEALTREATWRRLAELARRTDSPPNSVEEAALDVGSSTATSWRSIDDELAVLVYDSDQDEEVLENVRSLSSSTRRLTFQAPELLLEVEVTLGRPRALVCQVVPPQPATLEVRLDGGMLCAETDSFGTFHVPTVPPGPLSLRCSPLEDGTGRWGTVATSWVRI